MSLVPARVSTSALYDFTNLFVPMDTPTESLIELSINIDDGNVKAREFGAYLSLADRVYGRLSEMGLRSYSLTRNKQLRIAEIRKGSIELVITEVISNFHEAMPLVILYLFLKYLPGAIRTFSEFARNSADTWRSVEEAKLTRLKRKRLRQNIQQDETLKKLGAKRLNQLVELLDVLQNKENRNLSTSSRFADNHVRSIIISAKDKNHSG